MLVHESKKDFYTHFLHSPFPVESSLPSQLHDHLNAECVSGTVNSLVDALQYLTWTFFYRRLLQNPSYYNCDDTTAQGIKQFMSRLCTITLNDLQSAGCLTYDSETGAIETSTLGRIAAYYYLHYKTVHLFHHQITADCDVATLLKILCLSSEYAQLPVRHNEEIHNEEMSADARYPVDRFSFDSPHTKAHLLLQYHFSGFQMPITDFYTDLKTVLDQSARIIQSMVDIAADSAMLDTVMNCCMLSKMFTQGQWFDDPHMPLPHYSERMVQTLNSGGFNHLRSMIDAAQTAEALSQPLDKLPVNAPLKRLKIALSRCLSAAQIDEVIDALQKLPRMSLQIEQDEIKPATSGQMHSVQIRVQRTTKHTRVLGAFKPRDEGWWLIVCRPDCGELVALRRVQCPQQVSCTMPFMAPDVPGQYDYEIRLISDAYIGVDVTKQLTITVKSS